MVRLTKMMIGFIILLPMIVFSSVPSESPSESPTESPTITQTFTPTVFSIDNVKKLHSYFCLTQQQQLCIGISTQGDPGYDIRRLYQMQLKPRANNELKGTDYLKMRWTVDRVNGRIQLSNFTDLCVSKMSSLSSSIEVGLRPCGSQGPLEIWNLKGFLEDVNEQGALSLTSQPDLCLTVMECNRGTTPTTDFCSSDSVTPYGGATLSLEGLRGSYLKMSKCVAGAINQSWRQALDCAPGCSPFMMQPQNGKKNTCDEVCRNPECNWDNGACATPKPTPPTFMPTTLPTRSPKTSRPSKTPTLSPTTSGPTKSPITSKPTRSPTFVPTKSPTTSPTTNIPTISPSYSPSVAPSYSPSFVPTTSPSESTPTSSPSFRPTVSPTNAPILPLGQTQPDPLALLWLWILIPILACCFFGLIVFFVRRRRQEGKGKEDVENTKDGKQDYSDLEFKAASPRSVKPIPQSVVSPPPVPIRKLPQSSPADMNFDVHGLMDSKDDEEADEILERENPFVKIVVENNPYEQGRPISPISPIKDVQNTSNFFFDEKNVSRMSIKELKSFILENGGDLTGLVEKQDMLHAAEDMIRKNNLDNPDNGLL